jgi:hypothetical protein
VLDHLLLLPLLMNQQLLHLNSLSLECHQMLVVLLQPMLVLWLGLLQVTQQKQQAALHMDTMCAVQQARSFMICCCSYYVQANSVLGVLHGSAATRAVLLLLMLTVLLLHKLASIVFLVSYLFVNLNVFNFFFDLWPRGFSHACCCGVVEIHGTPGPSRPESLDRKLRKR